MGWDVTQVGSNITTRAFVEYYIRRTYDGIYESVKISEGANVDGQKPFYVALKKLEDNSIFACVILTQRKNGQVFTKVIGESEQPFFYEASAKFLEVLTPTTHLGALQWRADCLNKFISNLLEKENA
jgi:hypothetical protein